MNRSIAPRFCSLRNPVLWGIVATTLIVVASTLLGLSDSCFNELGQQEKCVKKWRLFLGSPPNEIGDTLAGMAGALAFIWIIVTVWLQSSELSAQRTELVHHREEFSRMNTAMREQRFEVTYFEMFGTLSKVADGLRTLKGQTQSISGRAVFSSMRDELEYYFRQDGVEGTKDKDVIKVAYEQFWDKHRPVLAHYFRYLFNFFRFLDDSEFSKDFHGKLLRSQLSSVELTLLFYNCLSEPGQKFEKYAVKFELFDNMDEDDFFYLEHASLIDKRAFGPDKRGLIRS